MTVVTDLAQQFGRGRATAAQVVAALKPQSRPRPRQDDLLEADMLGLDPELPDGPDSWADVEDVYYSGDLTDAQYRELYGAAFADTSGGGGNA